jgi:hypothetical protein
MSRMLVSFFAALEVMHLAGMAALEPVEEMVNSHRRHGGSNAYELKPQSAGFGFEAGRESGLAGRIFRAINDHGER